MASNLGCGPNSWRRHIPTWHAKSACVMHDLAYARGGTEADREAADYALYDALRHQAREEAPLRRLWMLGEAWVFYRFVRAAGGKFFHYHD